MFARIVVPLDGSELAERALPPAEEMARRFGAPLHLIRVADVTRVRFGANEAALEYAALGGELTEDEAEARTYLEQSRERLVAAGVPTPVSAEVRRGLADRELLAAIRPGDLIVMVTHGRGGLGRLLIGSVAEPVMRHATVPILLIRASDEPAKS